MLGARVPRALARTRGRCPRPGVGAPMLGGRFPAPGDTLGVGAPRRGWVPLR